MFSTFAKPDVATVRLVQILRGADGDNPGRVDGLVAAVIVAADVREVNGEQVTLNVT